MREGQIKYLLASLIIIGLTAIPAGLLGASAAAQQNTITGRVVDIDDGEPLTGVSLKILDRPLGTITDTLGYFTIGGLEDGVYRLRVSHVGYETKVLDSIHLSGARAITLNIELVKKPVSIKGVTVTPGQFSILSDEPAATQLLPREVIETRPQLAEDLFRAVQRLPGIAYNDFSAKFNVRGGEQDEVLINLDGMELYEPFHLKDVDGGVISVIDVAAMEGVDLMAGGYPANYGDRMSGVFNIKSKNTAADTKRISLGLSLMNARFLSEGTFSDNKGSWLVSARRGYLDLLLDLSGADDQLRPQYYDIFSKLRYKLNQQQILTLNFLRADDNLEYLGTKVDDENNEGDTLYSSYGSTYLWLTLDSYMSSKLAGKTITSFGSVSQNREGQVYDEVASMPEMQVDDNRSFDVFGARTDWEFEAHRNLLFKAGLDLRHVSADYDYSSYLYDYRYNPGGYPLYIVEGIDSNKVSINPSGDRFSGYFATRVRPVGFATAEVGVRYDRASYSDDEHFSPRANLALNLSQKTTLRCGWGHFYQMERIDEISVQDGQTDFHKAEKARHIVLGLDHNFATGENLRLNVFYKKYSALAPAYRNTFGELVTFPELEEDRVEVTFNGKTAKGVELYVKKDVGEKLSWWFSYSLSEVRDDIKSLYYFSEGVTVNYNEEFYFPYDQLHTMYLDLNYRFNTKWQFNVAWQYHTGWPFTGVSLVQRDIGDQTVFYLEADDPWRSKHDPFKRLDLRLNRKFFMSKGTITAFIEVINVTGAENIRNYEYVLVDNDGVLSIEKHTEKWFGTLPSFGIAYDYTF
ncbi:MAG: TonB-dependent receptor [Candidatus Zixiibacteriota bacterium]